MFVINFSEKYKFSVSDSETDAFQEKVTLSYFLSFLWNEVALLSVMIENNTTKKLTDKKLQLKNKDSTDKNKVQN